MNPAKAREFFSAYYEKSLEPGLRMAFEQRLESDGTLAAEYRTFERTMRMLESLGDSEVTPPYYLHQRISERIQNSQDSRHKGVFAAWGNWTRGLAISGLAAVAILATVLSIKNSESQPGQPIGSSLVTTGGSNENLTQPLDVRSSATGVVLHFHANAAQTVNIETGETGKLLTRLTLEAGRDTETPLENPTNQATWVSITISGEPGAYIVALPGREGSTVVAGEGSMAQMAAAIAGYYHVPVLLSIANPTEQTRWKFVSASADRAAVDALDITRFAVEKREGDLIRISDR